MLSLVLVGKVVVLNMTYQHSSYDQRIKLLSNRWCIKLQIKDLSGHFKNYKSSQDSMLNSQSLQFNLKLR